jgi:hypothetical protein
MLINAHHYVDGAEVGVWRGRTAFTLLEQCPQLEMLYLIDPWEWERCHFPVPAGTVLPVRMPPGWYHSVMGESAITGQADLDRMVKDVLDRVERDFPQRAYVLRGPSVEMAQVFPPGSLDFVYIDAVHLYEEVSADIEAWWPVVRKGGMLAGDDWGDEFPGVRQAVAAHFPEEVLRREGALWWTII